MACYGTRSLSRAKAVFLLPESRGVPLSALNKAPFSGAFFMACDGTRSLSRAKSVFLLPESRGVPQSAQFL